MGIAAAYLIKAISGATGRTVFKFFKLIQGKGQGEIGWHVWICQDWGQFLWALFADFL